VTDLVRLIVLDDDPMQLRLIERVLSREGFEVVACGTVAELRAEAARAPPEIVLVDINLPDAPPGAAVKIAREVAPAAHIVLTSASDEAEVRTLIKRSGADAFISKSESVIAIGAKLHALRKQ
jgi:DNA-binding response OmpR family regulator